jgi:hypothetical protein
MIDNVRVSGVPAATFDATMAGNYGTPAGGLYSGFPTFLIITIWGLGASVATVTLHVEALYTTKFFGLGPEPGS